VENGNFTKHKIYRGALLPLCMKHGNLEMEPEEGECWF